MAKSGLQEHRSRDERKKRGSHPSRASEGPPTKPIAKSRDAKYTQLLVYVPVELHRAVKSKLALVGGELSGLIEELLTDWNGRAHQD
jgi:hypothetical protein